MHQRIATWTVAWAFSAGVMANPVEEPGSLQSRFGLSLEPRTGVITFQDIQVPKGRDGVRRSDGTLASDELQDHSGVPLEVRLSATLPLGSRLSFVLGGSALTSATLAGPAATTSSTYRHLSAMAGAEVLGNWRGHILSLTPLVRYDSRIFRNISTGHDFASVSGGVALGWTDPRSWGFELAGHLGFHNTAGIISETGSWNLRGSDTRSLGWNIATHRRLGQSASRLGLGMNQDILQVHLNHRGAYRDAGLAVAPEVLSRPTTFELVTSSIQVFCRIALDD